MRNVVSKASIGLCVFGVLGNGCGGDKRECGPGTVLSGSQCIVAPGQVTPMPTSDGGDASMGVPSVPDASVDASVMPTPMPDATVVFRPTFGGVNSVAPASDSSLVVTWRPAKDAQTPREQLVYRVYVATAAGKQDFKKPTATSQPGSTSILLAGLTNNMPYYVVVRAVNQDGTEDTNTVEKDNRPRADSVAPTFGGVKSAKAVGAGSVELTWDAAKDDASPSEGITYTAFWSDKPGDAANGTFGGVSEPGAASMVVSGLPHSVTAYYFVVRAVDAAGNTDENVRSESATTTVDITPPQFAGCQSVIDTSAGAATLTWLPAKDDSTDPGSIVYTVFASTIPIQADGGGFDFAHRAEFKGGVTGRIGGLTQNTQWYFICQATDESGNQEHNLAQRRVKTQVDNVPPHFNGVTSASLEGFDKAKLTWEPASDDQTPAESIRYVVYQGEAA
ncbi:MAG TPA: fibronectin type III domain-containing protein, partial [Polyangiaceae bacterium]|nr:fibronectin type III domain-containing protein [Polyangiaceae bacterium]